MWFPVVVFAAVEDVATVITVITYYYCFYHLVMPPKRATTGRTVGSGNTAVVMRRHGGDGGGTAVLVWCYGGHGGHGDAAAIPLRIGLTRGGIAEVLNMFTFSAVPPRRSTVLTVFRGATAINNGTTAEPLRSWWCHCGLCRTSTAVAPRLRYDGGIRKIAEPSPTHLVALSEVRFQAAWLSTLEESRSGFEPNHKMSCLNMSLVYVIVKRGANTKMMAVYKFTTQYKSKLAYNAPTMPKNPSSIAL